MYGEWRKIRKIVKRSLRTEINCQYTGGEDSTQRHQRHRGQEVLRRDGGGSRRGWGEKATTADGSAGSHAQLPEYRHVIWVRFEAMSGAADPASHRLFHDAGSKAIGAE